MSEKTIPTAAEVKAAKENPKKTGSQNPSRSSKPQTDPNAVVKFSIERVLFSKDTGERLSKPKTMELERSVFEKFKKVAPSIGLTVKIK